ncbi:hypothetical protein LOCC1_G001343 [Lachnellula occidentalis]|uniref:BTB domain-containing protein n=1 Tax=Lachnellula occidentalis TaxID=215460 RepID=A0A8H8UKH0_9HELO|nr:hypothetical protein LOCC1_G001343 [Lachnellula occidentalis]
MASSSPALAIRPKAASSPDGAQNLFIFKSADVDITVTYKGSILKGRVSSHALCLASPAWHKFVYPPWSPIADQKEETGPDLQGDSKATIAAIDFKDDNGEALLLLLRVAHLKFADVPSKLSYEQFLNVAILCDEYDCVNLVKPWLSKWFAYKHGAENYGAYQEGDYLFIAWVFGRQKTFNDLAKMMLLDVRVTEENQSECLTHWGAKFSHLIPQGLTENFLKIRSETVTKVLEFYSRILYVSEDQRCLKGLGQCDVIQYGLSARQLDRSRLFDSRGDALRYNGSIHDLGMYIQPYPSPTLHIHRACDRIGVEIQRTVMQIMRAIPHPVLPVHRQHFTKELLRLTE